MDAPKSIEIPPEVAGYIQGLKDQIAALSETAAQRSGEVFGLRAQLGGALKRLDEFQTAAAKRKRKKSERLGNAEPPAA